MNDASEIVTATGYLQIEPDRRGSRIVGAKLVRLTQGRPAEQVGGTIAVKVTIRVPRGAFQPLEVNVTVPESLTIVAPVIEAEAVDPS